MSEPAGPGDLQPALAGDPVQRLHRVGAHLHATSAVGRIVHAVRVLGDEVEQGELAFLVGLGHGFVNELPGITGTT